MQITFKYDEKQQPYDVLEESETFYIIDTTSRPKDLRQAVRKDSVNVVDEKVPETYSVGQQFKVDGRPYLLAQVDKKKVALISLGTGNRWSESITVEDLEAITYCEMEQISSNFGWEVIEGKGVQI
jgi:hypothetical protein